MRYLKEFYIYNKKLCIIGLVVLISLIFLVCFFISYNDNNKNKNNLEQVLNYNLVLYGEQEMVVYQNQEFIEPGYYVLLNNQLTDISVLVVGIVDTSTLGNYEITYSVKDIKKTRIVKVIEDPNTSINDIKFSLNGESQITIFVGEEYKELGYTAYDKNNNDIKNIVTTKGIVNNKEPGTYIILYTIVVNGETKTLERRVIVKEKVEEEIEIVPDPDTEEEKETKELSINLNYNKSITNQNVVVNIQADGTNFKYIKLPNGKVVNSKTTTYPISENGLYYFYAYDSSNKYKRVSLSIKNIDKTKPVASCTAKSYSNKTIVDVVASDDNAISKYVYNNSYATTSSSYTISKKLDSVNVKVYDIASNVTNINCSMSKSSIEMHFIPGVSDDDAILIRTDDKTIMIDGGRYEASDTIISYLKEIGVTKIDALIGSHVHWNHVQSHAKILESFQVDKLYYPVDILNCVSLGHCKSDDVKYIKNKIQELNKTPIILKSQDKLTIGEMEIYVLGPIREKLTTWQNANSSVFILKYGDNKFMFTGDTPGDYMNTSKFLENASVFNMNIDIDVLKWPHHGYDDSTLKNAFFEATTPKYVIVPRYYCSSKWPTGTTKKQLETYGVTAYEVCKGQNVVLLSDGKTIEIKTNQDPKNYKR